jgi:S-adenosylmethionine:tRNA ribosyltransferase-isomerase
VSLRLSDYDYSLPDKLIAQRPLDHRDASRMMVLHRDRQQIEHRQFAELPSFIRPGDLLVLNDTRVVTSRRFSDDGAIEFLFTEQLGTRRWRTMVRPGRKMTAGATAQVGGARVTVEEICDSGERIVSTNRDIDFLNGGLLPLPPYVQRPSDESDAERYQTIYANAAGALAAPTAGLHFTAELLAQMPHTFVTLHVGTGTFRPVQSEDITQHQMHAERFSITAASAERINAAQRVIAVGTTTVRVLESAKRHAGKLFPQEGTTTAFIHPPMRIEHVHALLTNFHLPRSTLLMLVSAFAGREFVLRAYVEAIRERYRFYSYGDCMLIL